MSLDFRNIKITEEIFNSPEYTEYRKERLKILHNCGVYIINNKLNGHNYVGSSVNIKKRFSRHKTELRQNKHPNRYLQRAWNKYEEENFEFIHTEHIAYPDQIRKREIKNITIFGGDYNLIKVNLEGVFYYTQETKDKMSISAKGKKKKPMSEEGKANITRATIRRYLDEEYCKNHANSMPRGSNHHLAKKVYQYSIDGKFIKEWSYIGETKELGIDPTQVSVCVKGKHKTAFGYRWFSNFLGDNIDPIVVTKQQKSKTKDQTTRIL